MSKRRCGDCERVFEWEAFDAHACPGPPPPPRPHRRPVFRKGQLREALEYIVEGAGAGDYMRDAAVQALGLGRDADNHDRRRRG